MRKGPLKDAGDSESKADLLRRTAAFFLADSGCQAVGIRLKRGDDFPYFETHGFTPEFVAAENALCVFNSCDKPVLDAAGRPELACLCGVVLGDRADPSRPFFTRAGSFWTNSTTELLAGTTDADRPKGARLRCPREGYESMALIPLRAGPQILGLVQLNDRRRGRFKLEQVERWEILAGVLASALNGSGDGAEAGGSESLCPVRKSLFEVLTGCAEPGPSREDLEQFVNVASHDLKEPLRMMTAFLGLLKERAGGRMDERSRDYLESASAAALRMNRLIEDLGVYSRLGRDGRLESVAADELADEALDNLRMGLEEAGAEIVREPLPAVTGRRSELTLVFQNLIGNAVKFRGGRRLRIRLGAEREGAFWRFAVADNGIGIAEAHRERIFMMFERLHPEERYKGSGMGLAICRTIVNGHGGRIWVESSPGEGSVFHFTLPAAEGDCHGYADGGR